MLFTWLCKKRFYSQTEASGEFLQPLKKANIVFMHIISRETTDDKNIYSKYSPSFFLSESYFQYKLRFLSRGGSAQIFAMMIINFYGKIKNLWRTKTFMIFLRRVMGPENLFSSTWSRRATIVDLKVIKRTLSLANINKAPKNTPFLFMPRPQLKEKYFYGSELKRRTLKLSNLTT